MKKTKKKPIVLCIMDGWGINENTENNAVALAKTPNVDYLTKTFPYSTLDASGADVGLPIGQVGNSEVGHMNLGSGRVVLQTLPKINKAFENNEIEKNNNFQNFMSDHNKISLCICAVCVVMVECILIQVILLKCQNF